MGASNPIEQDCSVKGEYREDRVEESIFLVTDKTEGNEQGNAWEACEARF